MAISKELQYSTSDDVSISPILPGYNTPIPPKIMTPNEVQTNALGTLLFTDGIPDTDTVETIYNYIDTYRGVESFLNGIPATSLEGIRLGMADLNVTQVHQVSLFKSLMDSNSLFLTGNTDTVYAMVMLDLERDGPTVIEVPAGSGPGTVNDAWFRFVVDMGSADKYGKLGRKYVIYPPEYPYDIPESTLECSVTQSSSYVNWLVLRGFLDENGEPDEAVEMYEKGLKCYPLSQENSQPVMEFIDASNVMFNTIHANNYEFYHELDHVIQKEPISLIDPEMRGVLSAIGIQKGKDFQPDERMQTILTDAVKIGNAAARSIVFKTREAEAYLYNTESVQNPNSFWKTPFIGGSYEWLKDDGEGGRYLDARTLFFYYATVNTPAMASKMLEVGSQYGCINQDHTGADLRGDYYYKLNLPADVPAVDFWSIVVYDPQTRSELQTDQNEPGIGEDPSDKYLFPSINSKKDNPVQNEDGSYDIYFGPVKPSDPDKAVNWIKTVDIKGWFMLFRLYGPKSSWFDKTWRPSELIPVDSNYEPPTT